MDLGCLLDMFARGKPSAYFRGHPYVDFTYADQLAALPHESVRGRVRNSREVVQIDHDSIRSRFATEPRTLVEVMTRIVALPRVSAKAHHSAANKSPSKLQVGVVSDVPCELGTEVGEVL